MAKILLVYGDVELSGILKDALSSDNHRVEICHDNEQAILLLNCSEYDLLIVGQNVAGQRGLDLCASIRAHGRTLPVIYIGSGDTIAEKQTAFEAGVDDYLASTFNIRELSFRAGALLRRTGNFNHVSVSYADLELDTKRRAVLRSGEEIRLSPKEFALLEFFLRNPGRIFTGNELLRSVWSSECSATDQVVRTSIKRLRQRIDRFGRPSYIRNEYAHGYRLEDETILREKPPVRAQTPVAFDVQQHRSTFESNSISNRFVV